MLPLRLRVDLGVMAMKDYSTLPKAPELLKGRKIEWLLKLVSYSGHSLAGVLLICREAADRAIVIVWKKLSLSEKRKRTTSAINTRGRKIVASLTPELKFYYPNESLLNSGHFNYLANLLFREIMESISNKNINNNQLRLTMEKWTCKLFRSYIDLNSA